MMHQLALPMPAKPLPALALDGARQAQRAAFLADIAEWRRWHVAWWQQARGRPHNAEIVEANFRRECRIALDDMREFRGRQDGVR